MKGATNPQSFDRIVRDVFAPIYPVIAAQIATATGIVSGRCLDAGCGTGALGIALSRITDLHMTYFDQSEEMLNLASEYSTQNGLDHRSIFLQGDIHAIPLPDGEIDLVISRGSSPFWDDWQQAYSEILRILKPGAMAYVGGGFGNRELRDSIVATMSERNPDWRRSFKDRLKPEREALPGILERLSPSDFHLIDDESGFWAVVRK
ncbi:MAG: class I SAM-dependent methyltransferase [Sulfuricurvum sp.]|nr:class I SAM-dependent methyltransferase [Sulfuricurvum sp.]